MLPLRRKEEAPDSVCNPPPVVAKKQVKAFSADHLSEKATLFGFANGR